MARASHASVAMVQAHEQMHRSRTGSMLSGPEGMRMSQPNAAGTEAGQKDVMDARRRWSANMITLFNIGCAIVKDLVRPEAIARLNAEIMERKHTTHFSTQVMKKRNY